MTAMSEILGSIKEASRVWRDPKTGRFFKGELYNAQVIHPTDITAIQSQVVLEEVLGLARPQYVLRQCCRVIAMPSLTTRVDLATKLVGQEKVPAGVEAEVSAEAYTAVNFDLWKNVVHVVITDEAVKKAAHSLLQLHIEDAAGDLARMENKQIAEEMETATSITGTDWGTTTNNPFDDIVKAISTIEGNGYPVDFIAAHPLVWGDFLSNPFVRGTLQGVQWPSSKVFPVPGLPGVTGYSDSALTSTLAIVGSRAAPALVFGEGPVEAAQYRNEPAGYDAYIIRQWLQPEIVLSGAIRRLTGVHA